MQLTKEQKDIVGSIGRQPLLVIAGPGTGKTEVLSHGILHLLRNKSATKEEIVGITFTTKAAGSMRDRLDQLGLGTADQPLICTLHSFSARILREHGSEIGIKDEFLIADAHESKLTLSDAIMDVKPQAMRNLNKWGSKIGLLKAKKKRPRDIPNGLLKNVYTRYQELLRFHSALDFEDLVMKACRVLQTNSEVRDVYQSRCKHLLVDEFQDINKTEYSLIRHLAGTAKGLFVVGDDKQSIYSWRGGNPQIILGFTNNFPRAIRKPMTICFRCPDKIIQGADEFIEREPKLKPQQRNSEPIWILECKSDVQEARYISKWIETVIKNNQYLPMDVAILYRGGDIADEVAENLSDANIPITRPSPEETRHMREFIACLRLIVDRRDSLALRVCLASPLARGIGDAGIKKMRDLAENNYCSFWDALITAKNENSFKRWHKSLQRFNQIFEDLSATASKSKINSLLYKVAKSFGYEKEPRIVDMIKRSESIPDDWSLYDFIQNIRGLKGEKAGDPRESGEEEVNAVLFITMHSVKGLQRKVIFVLGMEKGSFPQSIGDTEEQKRLCYVAMTRAKEKLFLCYAKKREGRSAQGISFYDRSPFIFEIPDRYREFIQPDD